MNILLLVVAILLLPFAWAVGDFNGFSLLGVLAVGAFIASCVRRAGENRG